MRSAEGPKPPRRKRILLFADGTRNGSEQFARTNVWRMYQATDSGPHPEMDQITRYLNGVGDSPFRLIAVIQSIFAWGLKRNVVALYLFLCANYREGDRICMFGFSRGAFTLRVLADLIDKHGLIVARSPEELEYLARDVYRAYRRRQKPRLPPMRWAVPLLRGIDERIRQFWRTIRRLEYFGPHLSRPAKIDFIGLWDTVGAYGGPVEEIIHAIDSWILPIGFYNTRLPDCVTFARHALALDDERQSFEPIPWDESTPLEQDRLEQVWFAGMHADVGGGYVDDRLAHTTLWWMMQEAEKFADIRFLPFRQNEIALVGDAFAPIHDSRTGFGAYYRYQPRDIMALCWDVPPERVGARKPKHRLGQGLSQPIKLHESVVARILSGTDGYAPITVPAHFQVVSSRDRGESAQPALPRPLDQVRAVVEHPEWQARRAEAQYLIWDYVWWKRVCYFAVLACTVLLLAAPLTLGGQLEQIGDGGGGVLTQLASTPWVGLRRISPSLLDPWFTAYASNPWLTLALVASLTTFLGGGTDIETRLRRTSRAIWLSPPSPSGAGARRKSLTQIARTNAFYVALTTNLRWRILPALMASIVFLLGVTALLSLGSIMRMSWAERGDIFCEGDWRPQVQAKAEYWMWTNSPCNRAPISVQKHRVYAISFIMPDEQQWYDGRVSADPSGIAAGELMPLGLDRLFVGMRRALHAGWMQPLVYIVPAKRNGPAGGASSAAPITVPLSLARKPRTNEYLGTFRAPATGRLAIAVNEAIPPWPASIGLFYNGGPAGIANKGGACVRIVEVRPGRETQNAAPRSVRSAKDCGSAAGPKM